MSFVFSKKFYVGLISLMFSVMWMNAVVNADMFHSEVELTNAWVTQTMSEDSDFLSYDFTIPSDGKVVITTQTFRPDTYIYLYDDDQITKYYRQQINGGSDVEPETQEITVWLQQGTYHYIAADNIVGSFFGGAGDIRVKILFTPANNTEIEPNNGFEQAMLLEEQSIITGALLKIDDRYDFYKITPQPGTDVSLRITSYADAYSYTVYDSDFVEVMAGRASGSETSPGVIDFSITSPNCSLFYIKISDNFYGEDHTFGTYTLQWTQD